MVFIFRNINLSKGINPIEKARKFIVQDTKDFCSLLMLQQNLTSGNMTSATPALVWTTATKRVLSKPSHARSDQPSDQDPQTFLALPTRTVVDNPLVTNTDHVTPQHLPPSQLSAHPPTQSTARTRTKAGYQSHRGQGGRPEQEVAEDRRNRR